MTRQQSQILQDIDQFESARDGSWLGLESLLSELWGTEISEGCLPTLFRVFEKFPEEDGAGVFWSIVHGIESTDLDYQAALQASLARQSSEFGELMMSRLEKSR